MSIRIVIDSASDYTLEEIEKRNLCMVPLTVSFGDQSYKDIYELDHDTFFEKLIETDTLPTTSLISPYDYSEAFRKIIEAGDQVLCIVVSSKLSGCYQSACIAASEYDSSAVAVIDSLNACIGQRVLIERALELIAEGKTLSEIAEQIDQEKSKVRVIALLDTLEYLKKGGRISSTVAFAGTLLSIKPVVSVENGEVKFQGAARGSKNGNNKLMELVQKEGGIDFSMPYALTYSGLSRKLLDKYVKDSAHLYEGKIDSIPVSSMGSAIGTHVGPGAIGVSFFAK